MGYGYAETFLVIFLTHPGVVFPTASSAMNMIPQGAIQPQYEELIPKGGFPPLLSGLWQVLWAWILSLPGERSAGFGWTMYALYLVFLLVYMYLFLRLRMEKGV